MDVASIFDCLLQGMNLLDFFYLRDNVLPASQAYPNPKNTLLYNSEETSSARFAGPADIDWLASYIGKYKTEPVAYLGEPC